MELKQLEDQMTEIYETIISNEQIAENIASNVHPKYRLSSKNLYRYLLLRSFDLRKIHDSLSDLGLSSLRSSEGYVYSNLSNVLRFLKLLQGEKWEPNQKIETIGYKKSKKLLRKHARNLFIASKKKHRTEIMVTLPTKVSEDIDLLRNLVQEGMEIARINLGRDNMEIWKKMIQNIQIVREEMDVQLKIYMDLSGPKIRTSNIEVTTSENKVRNFIRLKEGEILKLTKHGFKGRPTLYNDKKEIIKHAKVGILIPEIIDDIKIDDRVFFDDGMIKGKVVGKDEDEVDIKITRAYKSKLSTHKGINLPDTVIHLSTLTKKDIELLPFVCENAEIVGYSFVQDAEDVKKLYAELEKNNNTSIGVVLKVENKRAFNNLPLILFEAMKRPNIGVMIARGDLAVEIGFERISEVQNEILWLCEAAHVPVIWATQVLENLSKKGVATRAEVSDAAISTQAECVMLNKGSYITDAVKTLSSIIQKMEKHSSKKKSKLRALNVAKKSLKKINANLNFNKESNPN